MVASQTPTSGEMGAIVHSAAQVIGLREGSTLHRLVALTTSLENPDVL